MIAVTGFGNRMVVVCLSETSIVIECLESRMCSTISAGEATPSKVPIQVSAMLFMIVVRVEFRVQKG